MKKQIKDPRQTLYIFLRISFITLFWIPFLYINIKVNNINRTVLILSIYIILILLIKRFYPKETEEYKLHKTIPIGYMFSGLWLFITLVFIFVTSTDYFKQNIFPPTKLIIIIAILLSFSIILFYYANKSRKYKKKT